MFGDINAFFVSITVHVCRRPLKPFQPAATLVLVDIDYIPVFEICPYLHTLSQGYKVLIMIYNCRNFSSQ